jgi:hypothetical protein
MGSKLKRSLLCVILSLVVFGSHATGESQSVLIISVDAVQLNNQDEPDRYEEPLLGFRVKNLDSGKQYFEAASSPMLPSVLHLPPGIYCLYSVSLGFNENLTYCKQPFFEVKEGRINNVGSWRFGVSNESGNFKLIHSFKWQADIEQQAVKRYPKLFDASESAAKPQS